MSFANMQFENEIFSPNLRFRPRKSISENNANEDSAYGSPGLHSISGNVYAGSNRRCSPPRTPSTPARLRPGQRWKSNNSELWGTVVKTDTFKELLPVAVAFLVMTSCVVLICTFTFGLDREVSSGNLNGKYKSIEFGHNGKLKRDAERPTVDVKDEDGKALGGKHAAIQFAHNMKSGKARPKPLSEVIRDKKHDKDLKDVDAAMDVINKLAEVTKMFNEGPAKQDTKEASDESSLQSKRSSENVPKNDDGQFRFAKRDSGKQAGRQFRFQAKRATDAEK